MEKRLIQLLVVLGLAFIVFTAWRPLWKLDLNEAKNPKSDERIIFEIEKGDSGKTIARSLNEADLVVSKKSFLRIIKTEELDQSLRYGRFVLSPSMTLREIVTILTTAGTGEMALTVVEGWTIDDIDTKLADLGLIEAKEFRNCTFTCEFEYDFLEGETNMEGFLFPDTYFIDSETFNSENLINQMLTNFDNKLTDEMEAEIEVSGRTLKETIIVASMLEKEVRTEQDIPIVSGIIWKRLDDNWPLGIDATLLYIQDDNELTVEDLAEESPYNTRINTGLPPTAISNPGLLSLIGAIQPEESEYWFYLTTPDTGEVIYGITNADHEANKEKYL